MKSGEKKSINSKKYILIEAVEYNWGETGFDSWEQIEWLVFSDGSYHIDTTILKEPIIDYEKRTITPVKTIVSSAGLLSDKRFSQLFSVIDKEWLDLNIESHACDGTAWRIRRFYPSGRVRKSTGRGPRYIYHQPIEQLAEMLNELIEIDEN